MNPRVMTGKFRPILLSSIFATAFLGASLIPIHNRADAQHGRAARQEPMPSLQGVAAVDYLRERGLLAGLEAAVDRGNEESRGASARGEQGRSRRGDFNADIVIHGETAVVAVRGESGEVETVRFFERGRQVSEEWVEVKKLTAAEAFGEEGLGLASIGNVSRLLPGVLPDLTSRAELRDDGGKIAEPGGTNALTDGPDPSQVYVQSISYGGTGCPQGSVGSSFSNDRKSFTLIFDSFVASSGSGVPVTENRKNCQINVNLRIPQGFQFSIASFDYRGYVSLPAGVTARQQATYYFQGDQPQSSSGTGFTGPVSKDYIARDTIPLTSLVWSGCGVVRPININAQVRLMGALNQSAQITTDSIDGKIQHLIGLMWRPC